MRPRANVWELGQRKTLGVGSLMVQAIRTHRTSVLRSGGLPNISRPTLNTLAANQSAARAAAIDTPIVSTICQAGGGAVDVIRISIPNVFIGGMKLTTVANV